MANAHTVRLTANTQTNYDIMLRTGIEVVYECRSGEP